MATKHQVRSRKTYKKRNSEKNYIFNKMAFRAGLILKSKIIRETEGV